jgi:DNA-binding GntR family transcriptional regulator
MMTPGARAGETKQQHIYAAVRERILQGAYGPGYRVVIDAIAAEFGVSALPVREAIRRLEAEGLVVFRPNAGAQVTPVDPELFEDEMTLLALLEGYATALAAPHLTSDDILELTQRTDDMARAAEQMDSLSFGRHNREFHAVFYARCPNSTIVGSASEAVRRLDAIRRTVFVQIPYRGTASIAEHRELIAMLVTGAQPSKIEAVARDHKLATLRSFQDWRRDAA